MSSLLTRREIILGAIAAAAFPGDAKAQTSGYKINNYPYNPDGISVPIGHRNVELDVGLLHPQSGAPTIGFYASLDMNHGRPFGPDWIRTYGKFIGSQDIHSGDRGTMIQIANHVRVHAVTAEQLANAYYTAKAAWDKNPNLRIASAAQLEELTKDFV